MASSSGSDAIRYDLNSDSRVFLCRHCENHVLSSNNFLDVIVTPGTSRILCREPVNVRGQLPAMPFSHCKLSIRQPPGWPANSFYPSPAVNVLCKQCNKYLGETLITGGVGQVPIGPSMEQRFMLHPGELLFWDGSRLVGAESLKPVRSKK